jgi:YD repeat-containing protein
VSIFDKNGSVTASIDPLGRTVRNEYDDANRLIRTVQPAGNAEERMYDARSNVIETCQLPKDRWDQHCNESAGDIVTRTAYVEGPTVVACVNPKTCNKPLTDTDAKGAVTNYSWSTNGDLQQILLPAVNGGRPQTDYGYTSYSAGGATFRLLTSITEKRSASENLVTSFSYDAANKYVLQSGTTDPGGLNLTTTLGFDAVGNLTSVNGPRTDVADVTTYQWDALRRPVIVTKADPDGGGPAVAPTSIVRFDADGLVNFTAELRDDGQWRAVVTQYDAVGRPTKVSRPKTLNLGAVATPANVAALALQTIASNDNFVETTYDADGRVDIVADPENRRTRTTYDAAGQVLKLIRGYGSPLQQDYQTNTWTSNGKLQSVASAKGFSTTYTYDGFDRPLRTTYPDTSFTEVGSYDKNGNALASVNRAGQAFAFSYDAANRPTRKASPDRVETYDYDLTGLQTCAETWSGGSGAATCGSGSPITRVSQAWDKAKRLASETQLVGGQTHAVGYLYGDKVNRTGIVWPDGWRAVYSYDVLNRVWGVGYDADGNGTTDGALELLAFDSLAQLKAVRRGTLSWGTAAATSTDLTWDGDGGLHQLNHFSALGSVAFTYGYDRSGKVISEAKPTDLLWSPAGPRTVSYTLGAAGSATEKLDQYASIDGLAATWDANGNRSSLNGLTTTHDAENRLVAASKSGISVGYVYDASGRRLMKDFVSGGSDTVFVAAGDLRGIGARRRTLSRGFWGKRVVNERLNPAWFSLQASCGFRTIRSTSG